MGATISGLAGWYWRIKEFAAAHGRREVSMLLLDLNVAGAGADTDGGASAVDDAADVVAVEAALHGDGLRDVDAAGAGVGVEVEVGVADDEANGTAAGGELPVGGGLPWASMSPLPVLALRAPAESLKADAAAAGLGFDVAGAGLARVRCRRSRCLVWSGPGRRGRGRSRSRSGP